MDDGDLPLLEAVYTLGAELGRGGFGVVLRGTRRSDGRAVAVKLPLGERSAEAERRILREARLLEGLDHPRLVPFLGCCRAADGRLALVYRLLEGRTLAERLAERLPDAEELVLWCRDVAAGLDAMHARALIHRDLKPQNVMVGPDGRLTLFDFGLLRPEGQGSTITASGLMLGTPSFMAPEQLTELHVTCAVDVYALGCLLYAMIAGAPPFAGPAVEVIRGHVTLPVPPLRSKGRVPAPLLQAAVSRALAKAPADRFTSAGALAEAVAAALAERTEDRSAPTVARPRSEAPKPPARAGAPTLAGPRPGVATPVPAPRSPLAGHGAGRFALGLLLGLAAGWATFRAPGGAAVPTAASRPAALAAAPPAGFADLPARVERGLAGRPREALAAASTDPLLAATLVAGLDGVAEFRGWLEAGGCPELRPPEDLRPFEATDARAEARGLPRPFAPALYVRPGGSGDRPSAWALSLTTCVGWDARDLADPWVAETLVRLDRARQALADGWPRARAAVLGAPGLPADRRSNLLALDEGQLEPTWLLALTLLEPARDELRRACASALEPWRRSGAEALYAAARALRAADERRRESRAFGLSLVLGKARSPVLWALVTDCPSNLMPGLDVPVHGCDPMDPTFPGDPPVLGDGPGALVLAWALDVHVQLHRAVVRPVPEAVAARLARLAHRACMRAGELECADKRFQGALGALPGRCVLAGDGARLRRVTQAVDDQRRYFSFDAVLRGASALLVKRGAREENAALTAAAAERASLARALEGLAAELRTTAAELSREAR